jgi:multidrug efflux pump subunit AcrA (membrane-fusion protein)
MQTEPGKRYQQASEVKAAANPAPSVQPSKQVRTVIERILPWAMLALGLWVAILCPVKNLPTLLMNAGPFAVLAFVFHRWRTGIIGGLLAGAATALAVVGIVFELDQSGKPHPDGALAKEIRAAEVELSALRVDYGENHPRVQKSLAILDALRAGKWVERPEGGASATVSGTNISPTQDGRLDKINVTEGQNVLPGEIVAVMDTSAIKMELAALKRTIEDRLQKEIREGDLQILKLESDLWPVRLSQAEDSAVIKKWKERLEEAQERSPRAPNSPMLLELNAHVQGAMLELQKADARMAMTTQQQSSLEGHLGQAKARNQEHAKTLKALKPVDLTDQNIIPLLPLASDEHNRREELLAKLTGCHLISSVAGRVEGIRKQSGQFVKAGEAILRITLSGPVGDEAR